ncbi:unnamed protein product [Moneuplotes crassus]|uniref:Uncharacterized protein n=1 Tax=Euplotes crassus TaxID=5936 RepID=A0AAD1UNN9_EUPCR|nr:unnamed protein product [Moneuplotes crassus]
MDKLRLEAKDLAVEAKSLKIKKQFSSQKMNLFGLLSLPQHSVFKNSMESPLEAKLFEKIVKKSESPHHFKSHYKRYIKARNKVKEYEKPLLDSLFSKRDSSNEVPRNHVNIISRETALVKGKAKNKMKSLRKSVLSIHGKEIIPKVDTPVKKKGYNEIIRHKYEDSGHTMPQNSPHVAPRKIPIPLHLEDDLSDSDISLSNNNLRLGKVARPPVRLKKIERSQQEEAAEKKLNIVMTPEVKINELEKQFSINSRKNKKKQNKLALKYALRKPTISPHKKRALMEYWKNKSLNLTKERLEKATKYRETIYKNSVLFLKNKFQVEEALGGNDQELYRKSLYGLFQIGKNFQAKYKATGAEQRRVSLDKSYLNSCKRFSSQRNTIDERYIKYSSQESKISK